jgi:DedD protein
MGLFSKLGKNKQDSAGAGQDSGYYTSADDQAASERARSKRASSADGPAKSRRAKDREADDPVLPEKKRARRRLVGAIALALGVAIGLPMVLDSEPKALSSDIEIKIPAKDKPHEAAAPAAAPVAASASLDSKEEIVDDVKPARPAAALALKPSPAIAAPPAVAAVKLDGARPEADSKADARAEAKAKADLVAKNKAEHDARLRQEADYKAELERKQAEVKAEARLKAEKQEAERKLAEAKAAKSEDARALAILEGKPAAAADAGQKFVLQVAALSDQDKVDELREKLKKAGISSFTQKAPTGGVTRIRVGPFSSKEEAEKVRAKLTGMGLNGRLETV